MEGTNLYVVDSSIFVAFYRDIDAHHAEALRIMQELAHSSIVVHPYVIQETATVLTYGIGLTAAKRFLIDITNASNVIIPAIAIQHDLRLYMACNAKISFTDCALIDLAKEMGGRLVSFDRQMLALARHG